MPDLSPETATALRRAMPGVAACLDRHEWQRHGVCSGLTPDAYFRAASENALRADGMAVASFLRMRRGGTVSVAEIEAAMAQDVGQAALQGLRLICTRRDRVAHLVELRFSLVSDGPRTFPRSEAFRPAGKGGRRCPANAIHVD